MLQKFILNVFKINPINNNIVANNTNNNNTNNINIVDNNTNIDNTNNINIVDNNTNIDNTNNINIDNGDINCKHDWIDYNHTKLNDAAKLNQNNIEQQLNRLLIRKINGPVDQLIDKMIELVITVRKLPKCKGKCFQCGEIVDIIYILDNTHIFMIQ